MTSPVQQLPFSAADRSNGHAVITLWPFQVVLRAPRLLQTTRRPLDLVKRRTLKWHDHVSRSSGLAKTILQGTEKGEKDKTGRRRGGKITSEGCRHGVRQVQEGNGEQTKMVETGCEVICGTTTFLAVKG